MHPRFIIARNIIFSLLLLTLGVVVGYRAGHGSFSFSPQTAFGDVVNRQQPRQYQDVSFETFWEVWSELEQDYLKTEKLDPNTMVDGAISGMTAALGDPYTVYLPPELDKRTQEELAGSFSGVGIELGYKDDVLAVVAPLNGTPADRAGVKAGDLILHVKDEKKNLDSDTAGWSLTEAVENIRGERGTQVALTLYREGTDKPFDVTLTRDEIVVNSVELSFVEEDGKKVAHIKLSRFGERTNTEWDQAVTKILAEPGVDGVILDMRNNPGGFFDGAIKIASDFIENGIVVSQKGKTTQQDFRAQGRARLGNLPVEVLVNRGSASASEIVAGALRDQRGAKLFGEKTFGKGTVQDRRQLGNGGGLHVTIAQWLMPKGESIQDTGLPVDIEVEDNTETPEDEVLLRAINDL